MATQTQTAKATSSDAKVANINPTPDTQKVEQIGALKLNIAEAKCSVKAKNAIIKVAKERSPIWGRIDGNVQYIAKIESIFNRILAGQKVEEIKTEYREFIPSSLSQAGPWLPDEVQDEIGRVVDAKIYTVKITKGQYQERVEWMINNGMKEPEKADLRTGKEVKCMRCTEPFPTPEPLLQHLCPKCRSEVGKGNGGTGNGKLAQQTILHSDLHKFASYYVKNRTIKPDIAKAALAKIEDLRRILGLPELTEQRIKDAKVAEDLI